MQSCAELVKELHKSFLEQKEIDIKQICIQERSQLFDDIDDMLYKRKFRKTNIYEYNDKVFDCDALDFESVLYNNHFKISTETYSHGYEHNTEKNYITITKKPHCPEKNELMVFKLL